jgi:hypothetical protein
MAQAPSDSATVQDVAALQERADRLEKELAEAREITRVRLIRAEAKAEAIRAGMIDLDGLKLIDMSNFSIAADGEVTGVVEAMAQFRKAKPWLFGTGSSSTPAVVPPVQPGRLRMATEMSDSEYKAARAALVKQYD